MELGCWIILMAPFWIPLAVWFILRPLLKWDDERRRRMSERRGFEVKPTSGESPGSREKDNDHG